MKLVWGLTNQIAAFYDVPGSRPIRWPDVLICRFKIGHCHGNDFVYPQIKKKTSVVRLIVLGVGVNDLLECRRSDLVYVVDLKGLETKLESEEMGGVVDVSVVGLRRFLRTCPRHC